MVIPALSRAFVSAVSCFALTCLPTVSAPGTYYLSVDGSDGNPGSLQAPWLTFAHALGQLSAGDTLLVREGVYRERDLPVAASGTAAAPILIANYPGERPVLDGAFPEFRAKGNSDWELHDAAKGLYRSKQAFPGAGAVGGFFGPAHRGWRLVPYEDRATLASDEEDYAAQWPYYYVGPGAFWDPADQRIYVRLKQGKYQPALGSNVPASPDPSDSALFLFPDCELLDFQPGVAHVEVRGIDLRYGERAVEIGPGAHHITIRDGELRAGRYAVLVRDQAHDLVFERLAIQGGFPDYVARGDVKQPTVGRPAHLLQGAGLYLDQQVERIEVSACTFKELFDAIDATGTPIDLHVHHSAFDTIRDDVVQLSSAGYRFEFAYNTLERVAAGVSWEGNGAPPAAQRGTKYIHHNVIDASLPALYGRSDPKQLLPAKWQGPNGDGMASGRAFGMHGESQITGPDPWKIYHNTIVVTQDVDGRGAGQCYYLQPFDPAHPHEVFNNIFVQTAAHHLGRDARVADGSQVFDGNLYHRPGPGLGAPLFLDFASGGQQQDFASLSAFLISAFAAKTKPVYAPGWEAAGVQADPLLTSRYVPDERGPAAAGAVDLSAKGWPGLVGEAFRGALDPVSNRPPDVDAGPDQDIKLAAFARLDGRYRDDGRPNPPAAVSVQWSQLGGPAPATFADLNAAGTTASFTATGRYVFQFLADDGELVSKDLLVVDVN